MPLRIDVGDWVPPTRVEPGTHRLVMADDIEQISIGAAEIKTIKVADRAGESITSVDVSSAHLTTPQPRTGLRAASGRSWCDRICDDGRRWHCSGSTECAAERLSEPV